MKDHYSLKKQWQLTLESWDNSTKDPKKVKLEEACGKSHKDKKKVKEVTRKKNHKAPVKKVKEEVAAAAAVDGAVTAGQPSEVADDGGYDSDGQKQIARVAHRLHKKPQTRHGKMGEDISLSGDMELSPEIDELIQKPFENKKEIVRLAKSEGINLGDLKDAYYAESGNKEEEVYNNLYDVFVAASQEANSPGPLPEYGDDDPEAQAADDELNNLFHMESIQRVLDEAFNKAIFADSIAFQEEEDEDMGMEDEIDDVDEMGGMDDLGDEELPSGNEDDEEMLVPEPEGEEIPEGGVDSDVNGRLDKIEGMLQQLLDLEGSEQEEIGDIEGEEAADLMGDMGMEAPVEDPGMPVEGEPEMATFDDLGPEEPEMDDELGMEGYSHIKTTSAGRAARNRSSIEAAERNRQLRKRTDAKIAAAKKAKKDSEEK